jgi:hypothetical protein
MLCNMVSKLNKRASDSVAMWLTRRTRDHLRRACRVGLSPSGKRGCILEQETLYLLAGRLSERIRKCFTLFK